MSLDSSSREKVEQKIGEALGLEMAAQKAVKDLSLRHKRSNLMGFGSKPRYEHSQW
jgi:hypothetical protein